MSVPLCRDCVHYQRFLFFAPTCELVPEGHGWTITNPVTGQTSYMGSRYCEAQRWTERTRAGHVYCGPEGRYFEAKGPGWKRKTMGPCPSTCSRARHELGAAPAGGESEADRRSREAFVRRRNRVPAEGVYRCAKLAGHAMPHVAYIPNNLPVFGGREAVQWGLPGQAEEDTDGD